MSTLALRNLIMWFWFDCVNDVWELDGVLDEENWNIISNDVPISFLCVKLYSEPAHVANRILAEGSINDHFVLLFV
jgi:hypothetical protein